MAEEVMQAGTHRGVLAGLSFDEREAKTDEYALAQFADTMSDAKVAHMDECAAEGPLQTTLAGYLETLTRDELVEIAKGYEIRGYSKLKKAELAQTLAERTSADDEDCLAAIMQADSNEYRGILLTREAGGLLTLDEAAVRDGQMLTPYAPWTYLYADGEDAWTFVVPEELRATLDRIDWDAVEAARKREADACHCAEILCDLCGVISIHDAWERYRDLYAGAAGQECLGSEDQFELAALRAIATGAADFGVWFMDDETYLVQFELDEAQQSPDDADGAEDLEGFKKYLVKLHEQRPVPQLDESLREKGLTDWFFDKPSMQALVAFFDAHVPEGEDDCFYADRLVEDIAMLNGNLVDFDRTVRDLEERGLCLTDAERAEMLPLLRAMLEDLPYWENNGWSNNAVREAEGGAKAFFGENGAELKVGRNDPCPCGSGKKYKKCCGSNK